MIIDHLSQIANNGKRGNSMNEIHAQLGRLSDEVGETSIITCQNRPVTQDGSVRRSSSMSRLASENGNDFTLLSPLEAEFSFDGHCQKLEIYQ
jgi:hypothetical protein